ASVQSPDTRYAGPLPLDQPMTLRVPTAGPGDPQAIYLPLIQTPPFQYSQWIPVSGGVMSVPGYGLVVQVPASYYAEPLRFVFTAVAQPPNMNALTTPYNFHLNAYTASGTEVTQFSQELTLVQSYKETVLGQVDPTSLYLAYFAGEWVALPSVVDEEMGTVTAVTDHFTRFAILGPLPSCAPDPEVGEFEIMSSSATQRIRTAYEASPLTECPLDYAYTLTTINNIDYAAQEFPGGAAIVDNPNLEQAFYIPPEIWLTYEQEAFLVGGVWLPEQPSAPEHFIDETGNNFREQEIWYFEYGFASVNNGEEWETHQYFPKFPAVMFAWEQAELDSEDYPRYRLRFQSDFEPSPAAEGVETSYPTPTPVTVQMTILDVTDDTISETVPILWNGTMAAEGASDYDYYITQTLKVYVAGIREDLIGYTRCNYYEPEPDARRYYYLTPTYPGPHNFEHNCIGGGMADTTPPDIEILQVYGSDVDPNSKWLEATVVVRITDDFGIASAAIQTSHGIVTQELQPYLSITYQNDPDVYAATFTEIPEHTTVTFTIEATDNSGLSASETANGYFADGQSFGFSACFNPCSSQLMGHQGKASPNPISDFGAKTEVYPLLAIPGPGEANVVIMPVYNSNSIRTGIFGAGISSDLETHLVMLYNPLVNGVEVVIGDGGRFRFEDNGDGTFTAVSQGNEDSLIQDGDGYVYTTRDQRIYRFDSNGRLASKEDRNGNAITYTYSGEQLTDITSGGRTVTLAYNGDGYVETLSIGEKTITLSYDGDKLVGIEDAMGGDWELTYESREIGEIIDERGEEFAYVAYNHFLTSVTTPARRIKNVQDY
ncbi:MAG TPA: hypothetical protein PLK31_13285, partial [Chloroflexota bacterium]|nr:hypothetical protein [Chloroflexota bacterium]